MKKNLRIFSAFLAVLLFIFPLSPLTFTPLGGIPVNAASGLSGTCTWSTNGPLLLISGNGATQNYTPAEPAPWGTDFYQVIVEEGVTALGNYALAGSSIVFINVPSSLSSVGAHAFENCTGLNFPLTSSEVVSIGDYAFSGCTGFSLATLPETVKVIGNHAFSGCTNLNQIVLPASLESLSPTAFLGCTALSYLEVDKENSHYVSDAEGVLMNRSKTTMLCFPAGKTQTAYEIPNSVTVIGQSAMQSSALKSVVLSANIRSVESAAFENCTSLTDVYFAGSAEEWKKISIGEKNAPLLNATLHVNHCPVSEDGNHLFEQNSDVCTYCSYKKSLLSPVLKGDTTGNGIVDSDDAIHLLYSILLGETRYPLNQPCDFNADRSVNSDDAIYLLYHSLLGSERYPLP